MIFEKLLDDIDRQKRSLGLGDNEECFFRGADDRTNTLLPSLFWRYERALGTHRASWLKSTGMKRWTEHAHLYKLQSIESGLFWDFSARAREIQSSNLTDWDVLFTMRHHGVATRLLDWTTVVGVAIYFAVGETADPPAPCIWLLDPAGMNEHTADTDDIESPRYLALRAGAGDDWDYGDLLADWEDVGIGWKGPIAIQAPQRDARIHAQRGYFTIHGDDRRPINEQTVGRRKLKDFVKRVDIPREAIPGARKFLSRAGIDRYLLFPELESLGKLLNSFYEM